MEQVFAVSFWLMLCLALRVQPGAADAVAGNREAEPWAEFLGWKPRSYLFHNFLTEEECNHLIKLGTEHLERSMVVDSNTGDSYLDEVRTSSGAFLERGQDEIVMRIEDKIARWTHLPAENGEGLQVLKYEVSQEYQQHYDYFEDKENQKTGGQRVATLLMYLTDVEEGGETTFPDSKIIPRPGDWSDCARSSLAVAPKRGDALLFYGLDPLGKEDPTSLHVGCPVIKGEKWSATKWYRVSEY